VRSCAGGGLKQADAAYQFNTTPEDSRQMGQPFREKVLRVSRSLLKTPFIAKPNSACQHAR